MPSQIVNAAEQSAFFRPGNLDDSNNTKHFVRNFCFVECMPLRRHPQRGLRVLTQRTTRCSTLHRVILECDEKQQTSGHGLAQD